MKNCREMVFIENVCRHEMDILQDLLPGIEDFLSSVLANESLSPAAEEQRLYFLERLDIIKLPPSIPPRPQSLGVGSYLLNNTPIRNELEDFAAYQRELSRALVESSETTADVTEVKLYDDIELLDNSNELKPIPPENADQEESMYEIPQLHRTPEDAGYDKAMESPLPPDKPVVIVEQPSTPGLSVPVPPPLPPRFRDRCTSESASRSSIGSLLDENTLDLVGVKPNKIPDHRSDKSDDFLIDEDQESCDSLDDCRSLRDADSYFKQLPQLPVKRNNRNQHRKLGKSLSSLWEVTQPFSSLEDIVISGELHYRSKLSWTRKIAALTNGRLVCYKLDKTDSRPSLVILLNGYKATFHNREGRRSFEIHLEHENFESYVFLVDFKEWAEIWCEHINAAAEGKRATGPVVHLARGAMIDNPDGIFQFPKTKLKQASSTTSLVSTDSYDVEPGLVKVKKRDKSGIKTTKMGTFAFRATQFFESLGRKSSFRKDVDSSRQSTGSDKSINSNDKNASSLRKVHTSMSQASLTDSMEKSPALMSHFIQSSSSHNFQTLSPVTTEFEMSTCPQESSIEVKRHIKHQGYLHIYSSFNKRRWGKRWCMVHENSFECYHTQSSEVCELEFPLGDCLLRRAVDETKSEMGLMLVENDREKITIEPMNWTELGSWLRVLMQETNTKCIPSGLEAYMDDTNPYHEAIEIMRLSDPNRLASSTNDKMFQSKSDDNIGSFGTNSNRDSGICSSGSADGKFSSIDRKSESTTPEISLQPSLNDTNTSIVNVGPNSAIYTQIRKVSVSTSPSANKDGTNNKCKMNSVGADSQSASTTSNSNTRPDPTDDDTTIIFDFNNLDLLPDFKRSESLVDEVMAQLQYQHDHHDDCENVCQLSSTMLESSAVADDIVMDVDSRHHSRLSVVEHVVNPITPPVIKNSCCEIEDFLYSNFSDDVNKDVVEDNVAITTELVNANIPMCAKSDDEINEQRDFFVCENIGNTDLRLENINKQLEKVQNVDSCEELADSFAHGKMLMQPGKYYETDETLADLRTRCVQLKKERISIKDRKQKMLSYKDKQYLDAEYSRLDRECKKVSKEIASIEQAPCIANGTKLQDNSESTCSISRTDSLDNAYVPEVQSLCLDELEKVPVTDHNELNESCDVNRCEIGTHTFYDNDELQKAQMNGVDDENKTSEYICITVPDNSVILDNNVNTAIMCDEQNNVSERRNEQENYYKTDEAAIASSAISDNNNTQIGVISKENLAPLLTNVTHSQDTIT